MFNLFIGNRVLQKELPALAGDIPLYSANVFEPFGSIKKSNINDFNHPSILWGIDGNFEINLIPAGEPFGTTDHCGTIQILDPAVVPEYLLYALILRREDESFDRTFRASLSNMRRFTIAISVCLDGKLDVKAQKAIANKFTRRQEKREILRASKKELDDLFARYMP